MFGAYVGFQNVLTLYHQNDLRWTPLQTAAAFLLGALLTGVLARRGAAAVTRHGAWAVATIGLLVLSVSYLCWALSLGHVHPLVSVGAQQLLGGVGFAAAYRALNIAAVGAAEPNEQGLASRIFNSSGQIGAALILAATGTALSAHAHHGLDSYRAGLWTITGINLAVTLLPATSAFGDHAQRRSASSR